MLNTYQRLDRLESGQKWRFRLVFALLAINWLGDWCWGATPEEFVAAAAKHLSGVDPAVRPGVRYIAITNDPEPEDTARLVNFWLNTFSRSRVITQFPIVDGLVMPIYFEQLGIATNDENLRQVSIKTWARAWENLALGKDNPPESYFHVPTEFDTGQRGTDKGGSTETALAPGAWVGSALSALNNDCQSQAAIIPADYFLAYATQGTPYYVFSGIHVPAGLEGLLKKLGIDEVKIKSLNAFVAANLLVSNITDAARRIVVLQGPFGRAYITLDVADDSAVSNPLRFLDDFEFDAGEVIAFKPNGLHYFLVTDKDGNILPAVDPDIAHDRRGDGVLVPGRSCVTCHKEGGFRPFTNDQLQIPIRSDNPVDQHRYAGIYLDQYLPEKLARDRIDYDRAVAESTNGWTAEIVSEKLSLYLDGYGDRVGLEWVAAKLGVDLESLKRDISDTADPIISGLLLGKKVKVETLAGSWPELASKSLGVR